jgi:hypothetical protein
MPMIVYVESNFILELAFLQEEHGEAETLAKFAESGQIQLAVPSFSGSEPYDKSMSLETIVTI